MRIALILTGYIGGAKKSFPHYLRQIKESTVAETVDIFGSVHSTTGQGINGLSAFHEHFTDIKTFAESESQKKLPGLLSRGHPSIAEFAEAVTYWRPKLENYDVIWRARWDHYLDGDSPVLDAQLRNFSNLDCIDVLTRSMFLNKGRPGMEGKHHWVTSRTAIEAFDKWEAKWTSWIDHIGDPNFDAHLTWAEIYSSIKSNVAVGNYSVEKVKELPTFSSEFIEQQEHRRKLLEEKIRSRSPR